MSLSVDLLKFALLFSSLYASFGVASPFLPELLSSHGISPERLGLTLSLATTIRLISAPLAGRIADRYHALRIVLATCAALAGAAALVLLPSGRVSDVAVGCTPARRDACSDNRARGRFGLVGGGHEFRDGLQI